MSEDKSEFIELSQLRIGMFIELELGWMSHPFPKGSFKISSNKQIEIIQGLGLTSVRYVASKSEPMQDPRPANVVDFLPLSSSSAATVSVQTDAEFAERQHQKKRSDLLGSQQRDLMACERRFGDTVRQYKQAVDQVNTQPRAAMEQCLALVSAFVGEMVGEGESAIRLLSEGMGDKASMHPVNVTVVSLLLGRALGLNQTDMLDLGMAAFLHDIGKFQLPDRVRWPEENFSSAEYKLYQEHVGHGVAMGQRMELTPGALQAMAQHHELIDGSGFPLKLRGDGMSMSAKILALVNRYDNLCNPSRPAAAVTPHEALSLIFTQLRTRFDGVALAAFIRMMGVYPPGSVVQLVDDRFAMVVSVNSSRPLRPRIVVYDPGISKHDALIIDLERAPEVGIRRSLKPASLPRAAMDFLSPRQRICYFFERATYLPLTEVAT